MRELEITLKWAQTLDGQLADDDDQSQWISGPEERRYTHSVRARHDGIVVGAQTFLKDLCQLTVREAPLLGVQPVRIILDPRGRVREALAGDRKIVAALEAGDRTTYLVTDVTDADLPLLPASVVVIRYRLSERTDWLRGALYVLAREFARFEGRELGSLMVEGGASTLELFLNAGLVDRLEVAVSPLILGGEKHRVRAGRLLRDVERFRLESQESFGADVVLRYRARRTRTRVKSGARVAPRRLVV